MPVTFTEDDFKDTKPAAKLTFDESDFAPKPTRPNPAWASLKSVASPSNIEQNIMGAFQEAGEVAKAIPADIAAGLSLLKRPENMQPTAWPSPSNIRRAIKTNLPAAVEASGNIPAALKGEPLPIEKQLTLASQDSPTAAVVAKISQGIAQTAPMIAIGGLPVAAQRAALLGFTTKMISDAPEIAQQLGDELGKPKGQQDPDKITSLVSDAVQTIGFSVGGALGAKRGLTTPTPKTYATQTRQQPISSQREHIGTPPQRIPTETGGGNRPVEQAKIQPQPPEIPQAEEVKPPAAPAEVPAGAQPAQLAGEPPAPGSVGPGLGAALYGETTASQESPTSIKNAQVDLERQKRGLPPAMQPARRSFGAVWNEAMARIDQDPDIQDRLIDSLRETPRAVTDLEDALLLHRQVFLQNQYGAMTRELAQAYDDAKEFPNRRDDVEELKVRTAGLSDKLLDLYNIDKKVGTATARGLNARRMMAYEDFSLAKMELDKRAANGGRPLTDGERVEIQKLHDRIAQLEKQYDDYTERHNQAQSDAAVKEALARVQAEAKAQPIYPPKILAAAERIVVGFENRAKNASDRLRSKLARVSAGLDPTIVLDVAEIGAGKLARATMNVAEWTKAMLDEYGPRIEPYLKQGYEDAKQFLEAGLSKLKGADPEKVKRAVKGMDTGERKEIVTNQIKAKIAKGKRNEITNAVQRLARLFVQEGVKDRDDLIEKVHAVLVDFDPTFTRRETMDAISGYGDFRQLSKDEISVELRSLKGQMQQVAKLEDMRAGKPPLKTGIERRAVGSEESRLIKQVNEAKRKFQIPIDDPDTQLRSSLDELKKRMQTRIADLNERLANRDFATKKREPIKLDATAAQLKADLNRAKQKFMRGLIEDRLKNRPSWVRWQDTFLRWYRGGILSSPVVFAKLTAAAIVRAGLTPLEEAAGIPIGMVIPKIAARAKFEGGWNSKAMGKYYTSLLTKGPINAWKVLTTGEMDIDVLYGKGREGAIGEMQVRPFSPADVPGRTHGAAKAPTKVAEFDFRLEKGLAWGTRNGVDTSNPAVEFATSVEAYRYANRSIFLQDNRVVLAYNRALRALEEPSKTTGKPLLGAKTVATVARTLVPIVRVPSNIVAETLQFATGSVTGSARAAMAMKRGVETLPEEQADLIMRELKKGLIGGAALLVGFLLSELWGGYYQTGEKRPPTDVKAGQARIPGVRVPAVIGGPDVPQSLLHHPLFETIQAGATIRRIAGKNVKEGVLALPIGVEAALLGLIEEAPFVREMIATGAAFDANKRNAFFAELAKSITEPQLIQWIAKQEDVNAQGETIQRKPKTFGEHLEMGIPGLRQNVPVKTERGPSARISLSPRSVGSPRTAP